MNEMLNICFPSFLQSVICWLCHTCIVDISLMGSRHKALEWGTEGVEGKMQKASRVYATGCSASSQRV